MAPKLYVKLSVDALMTVLFLICLDYPLLRNMPHEVLGTALAVCILVHNGLNWSWYRHLFAGKYTPFRGILTAVNLLLLISMAGMIISGIMLSRHVFTFLQLDGSFSARRLHPFFACWDLLLMGIHLGLNGGLIKLFFPQGKPWAKRIAYACGLLITLYGLYAFIRLDLADKMLMQSLHVGRGTNGWLLLADYAAILLGAAFVVYQLVKWATFKPASKPISK